MKPETFKCNGYTLIMTAWRCIENQLSPYCLPGFPCETCGQAIGLSLGGMRKATPKRRKIPAWLKDATPAVRRAYLKKETT